MELLRIQCIKQEMVYQAAVRKTSSSGVSEDTVHDYSTTGCFVEGSQMNH